MPAPPDPIQPAATSAPRPARESVRLTHLDGTATTIQVARFERSRFEIRIVAIDPCMTLVDWCEGCGAEHAIVGGFYLRPGGPALGDLRIGGNPVRTSPFEPPWNSQRACIHINAGRISLASRIELPSVPDGDLLQAGPMLVADGRSLIHPGEDAEGFSAGSGQFDSDITAGRYPRAALGLSARDLIAIASEGRADVEAGLTLDELARAMVGLGAKEAINLDGGGSTSLVIGGALVNTPREEHGKELVGGREVATALQFVAR